MTKKGVDLPQAASQRCEMLQSKPLSCVGIFLASYVLLFFGMTRRPGTFDEGIMLTGAMRVAANQIPHRDFYVLYGPAQFYILAGLFKIFGESVLVERLYDLFSKALVVTSVYAIASAYCRKFIAACGCCISLLWLLGLNSWAGSASIPVSALNLISSALILPVFCGKVSRIRMFAAGASAGLAALFRYDTGLALLGIHILAMGFAAHLLFREASNALNTFLANFWPYLLGFAVLTVPPGLYYLSVAPIGALIRDVITYPSKYYYRGRNLPFPRLDIRLLENLGLYLPILIAGISLYVVSAGYLKTHGRFHRQGLAEQRSWYGFLFSFGLLTVAMYLKGFVRVALAQMYLAIIPSVLLIAVLFEHRESFPRGARIATISLALLTPLPSLVAAYHEGKYIHLTHMSVPQYMWSVARQSAPPSEASWCKSATAVSRGFCFLPEEDRVQTIKFIEGHTRPDQRLYVGLIEHQRIFAGDNLLYFATGRLPATKWSELDPDLQSRYDIQAQMVHELETNPVPYIVLDSEFEWLHEPNDSSRRSGVTLLDSYIRNKYEQVEDFGALSIWKRKA